MSTCVPITEMDIKYQIVSNVPDSQSKTGTAGFMFLKVSYYDHNVSLGLHSALRHLLQVKEGRVHSGKNQVCSSAGPLWHSLCSQGSCLLQHKKSYRKLQKRYCSIPVLLSKLILKTKKHYCRFIFINTVHTYINICLSIIFT